MGLLDQFRESSSDSDGDGDSDATSEQLAASDPAPRGEDRDNSNFLVSVFGNRSTLRTRFSQRSTPAATDDRQIDTVPVGPPADLAKNHQQYFREPELGFTRAGLKIFTLTVTEPGYTIEATVDNADGEGDTPDEEMQDALREWASQCAIDAAESGQDLSTLLKRAPIVRYSKGTGFIEKVGTREDPDALAALVYHKPETFTQYLRENKSLVVKPDDDVDLDHPTTPTDEAAGYVQYDGLSNFDDGEIPFAFDDIIKLTLDADDGDAWGSPIWDACGSRIDALVQKLKDRDASIRTVGHNHRIYSSENWTQQNAEDYAEAHKEGSVSAGPEVADYSDDPEGYRESWPGRVDFVPSAVEVQTVEGQVADIDDAVMDDIEAIFSVLPVSQPKIAYASDINQFVIGSLDDTDDRLVDEERRYLERTFAPIFEEKADELAGGEYEGNVSFRIEPDVDANPIERSDFPAENLAALTKSVKELKNAGVGDALVRAILSDAGYDMAEVEEEHGQEFEPEDMLPELDEGAPPDEPPPDSSGNGE